MNPVQGLTAALTPLGLLWTVLILGAATVLHELAHFALARWQGVAVKSFSVGMGPVLWRRTWRGTEWRLSLLPLGGYVEIDGMAAEPAASGVMRSPERGFTRLPAAGKIAVLLAGPVTNLLLGMALMTALLMSQGVSVPDRARIDSVLPGSAAERLGLRRGDVITGIDGQDLPDTLLVKGQQIEGWQALRETLTKTGRHSFAVVSGATTRTVTFDWEAKVDGKQQLLGIHYGPDRRTAGFGEAVSTTVQVTAQAVPQVVSAFGTLFKRFLTLDLSRDENVSGPIGTAEVVSQAAATSPWALVQVAVMLNLSLAFFNLIPVPGLDGGRILVVLIGALKGKPLTHEQETLINVMGFSFVMLLMAFVVIRDVVTRL